MRSQFLYSQVKVLHDSGLFDSADVLAQNIICHGSPPTELLILYASTLYKKKEFSRAANYYERAATQCATEKRDIRFRDALFGLSKCKLKENQLIAATAAMQRINPSEMTPRMLLHLARLHRLANSPHSAAKCYTEILKRNPLAIEAATALADLGAAPSEILMLSSQKVEVVLDQFCTKHPQFSRKASAGARSDENSSQQQKRTRRRSSSANAATGISSTGSNSASRSSSKSRLFRKPTTRSATQAQQKEKQLKGEAKGGTPRKAEAKKAAATPTKVSEPKERAITLVEAEAAHVKRFIELFVAGCSLSAQASYAEAMPVWGELSKYYRKHVHVLQKAGICAWQQGNTVTARSAFDSLLSVDPFIVTGMDAYADLLKQEGQAVKLNEFTMRAVAMAAPRHEAWTSMALYCLAKGQKDLAKAFTTKAMLASKNHLVSGTSLALRGQLQLQLQCGEAAIDSFRRAQSYGKSLAVYSGLVRAYHLVSRHDEALFTAKEACIQMPTSAVALTLLALAYLKQKVPNRMQAEKLINRALKMDPDSLDVGMAKVQLLVMDDKCEDAMEMLKEQLKKKHKRVEIIYTRMAEVAVKMKKYAEAIIHYHEAVQLNPAHERAVAGLAMLEKMLNRMEEDDDLGSEEDSLQDLEDSYDDDDFDSFL